MLDKFIFENHLGMRFDGLSNGVYLNSGDMRDYSWNYDTINNRISRFYKPITNRKLPLVVHCNTADEATKIKNRLLDLSEADIVAKLPGKVYAGEYYTKGYITASKKSNYLLTGRYNNIDLTLTSDDPSWYREQMYSFMATDSAGTTTGDNGSDYPYDYPYDYAVAFNGRNIVCEAPESSEFILRISGYAVNPMVIIGGHTYSINGVVGSEETLVIDSASKTITLTTASGAKVNYFHTRSKESYIFEPIPSGINAVNWSGAFSFDLTVVEKRSEPKWT